MTNFRSATVTENADIKSAIEAIDRSSLQIALVVDGNDRLLGTVTDGDIRRGILHGIDMGQPVSRVMNKKPTIGKPGQSRQELVALMKKRGLRHIPLIDDSGTLIGIEILNPVLAPRGKNNIVVIMAGGLGKRLGALTQDTPKPMLSVKNKPLLESIVMNLEQFGFQDIFISVNYKRDVIRNHFGFGDEHNVRIRYLEEEKPLGTVGSLSLLPERPQVPFLVMNADLVTNLNLENLLEFHLKQKATATVCVRDYDIQVPYGVVRLNDKYKVLDFEEKPKMRFFVNAGIYVLDPKAIDLIPPNTPMDMPELFEQMIREKMPVSAFPVRENWVDIGQVEDFERANRE